MRTQEYEFDVEKMVIRDLFKFSAILDREKQFEIAKAYRLENDPDARDKLIQAGVRWAIKLAYVYGRRYEAMYLFLDLVEEAMVGLILAVDKFRPEMGNKLSTYATFWIKQRLGRFIIDNAESMRLPMQVIHKISRLRRFVANLEKRLNRKPTDIEIVAEGFDPKILKSLRTNHYAGTVSLNQTVGEGEDGEELTIGDIIPDTKSTEKFLENIVSDDARGRVVNFLETRFPARSAHIVVRRYGLDGKEPQTLESVGKDLEITRERVRQLEQKVLKNPSFVWFMTEVFRVTHKALPTPVM